MAWKGDALLVHDATQMLHLTRSTLAAVFGLKEDKVRVLAAAGAVAAGAATAGVAASSVTPAEPLISRTTRFTSSWSASAIMKNL